MAPASTLSGLGQNVVSNSKQFLPLATTGDKDRIVFRTPLTSTSANQNQFIRTAVSDIFSVDVEKYTETLIQMEDHVHQTKIKLEKTRKEANKRAKKINEVKGQIRTATADIKVRNSALAQGGRFEGSLSFSLQKELLEALSPQHSLQMVNQLTGKEEQVQDLQKKNQDLSAELETAKSESKRKRSELETVIEERELDIDVLEDRIDTVDASNQDLRDQHQLEVEQLDRRILILIQLAEEAEIEHQTQMQDRRNDMADQMGKLTTENAALSESLSALRIAHNSDSKIITRLMLRSSTLKSRISQRSRHNRSMGIQLDSSTRSNQQLRDDIGQLKEEKRTLEGENGALRADVQNLVREKDVLAFKCDTDLKAVLEESLDLETVQRLSGATCRMALNTFGFDLRRTGLEPVHSVETVFWDISQIFGEEVHELQSKTAVLRLLLKIVYLLKRNELGVGSITTLWRTWEKVKLPLQDREDLFAALFESCRRIVAAAHRIPRSVTWATCQLAASMLQHTRKPSEYDLPRWECDDAATLGGTLWDQVISRADGKHQEVDGPYGRLHILGNVQAFSVDTFSVKDENECLEICSVRWDTDMLIVVSREDELCTFWLDHRKNCQAFHADFCLWLQLEWGQGPILWRVEEESVELLESWIDGGTLQYMEVPPEELLKDWRNR
jgi:hypothetical protein